LPALEVAVGRRGAPFAGGEDVRIHAEAHRAARAAPLEAGPLEHRVEPLLLRLAPDGGGAWDDHRPDGRMDVPAVDQARDDAEILDSRVGAGADEHAVDVDVPDRGSRLEGHVR